MHTCMHTHIAKHHMGPHMSHTHTLASSPTPRPPPPSPRCAVHLSPGGQDRLVRGELGSRRRRVQKGVWLCVHELVFVVGDLRELWPFLVPFFVSLVQLQKGVRENRKGVTGCVCVRERECACTCVVQMVGARTHAPTHTHAQTTPPPPHCFIEVLEGGQLAA